MKQDLWPDLPYAAWKDTYATLHLWTQIVGKIRLALTPWVNREYVLPYEAVRTAEDPDRVLMSFLMSTYETAAINGKWDRKALETTIGVPGKPRAV